MKLVFRKAGRAPIEVEVQANTRVVDACDAAQAPVPFSCRGTSCGTCCMKVHEGADLFDDPGDEELDLLEALGHGPSTHRLACTAKIGPRAEGRIVVEAENDD